MTLQQAMEFIEKHGAVLASAKGPVPNLAEAIAAGPIKGSWWGHAKNHQIFTIFEGVVDSGDVLVCRLINGKRTFVHRRLWPALARAAKHFDKKQISQVTEEHTSSGRHVAHEIPFPKWVPKEVLTESKKMSEKEALAMLCAAKLL
jgi:hypothetical protein